MSPLTRLRRRKGWSIRDLAREAGVSPGTILRLEHQPLNGDGEGEQEQAGRGRPRPATLRRIAVALGVSIADLLVAGRSGGGHDG